MKLYDLGGTIRSREVDETLLLIKPLLRKFGITRLANVTGLDHVGIPVWMAIRPMSRSLSVSQGKGTSDALAKVSAAMEAIELYHAEQFVPNGEEFTLGQAHRDQSFLDPIKLPLRLDADLDENRVIKFVTVLELHTQKTFLLPKELIDRDARLVSPKDGIFFSSSNGLASGNNRTEAILHGLSEVVERDQLTFWTLGRELSPNKFRTKLIINSIDDLVCKELIRKIENAGLYISIWYATSNVGVPCFVCTIWDVNGKTYYPQRASGNGCHPYKRIALSRAITEAAQSRLTHISGSRDDMYWKKYRNSLPVSVESNQIELQRMISEPENISYSDIPEAPNYKNESSLFSWLVDQVEKEISAGIYVADLSDDKDPISVVQIFVPELEISAKKNLYTPGRRAVAFINEHGLLQ